MTPPFESSSGTEWRDVFERWRSGVAITRPDGEIVYANPWFCASMGYDREELVGTSFTSLVHAAHRTVWAEECGALAQGDRDSTVLELRCVRKDGSEAWDRVSASALRTEDGEADRIVALVEDHTERREAEERVHESERRSRVLAERLTTTLESITDAFFTLDRQWRFTYLNGEAERLLERPRQELLGQSVWDEFPEAKGSEWEDQYARALATGEAVHFTRFYAPVDRWLDVRAFPSSEGLAVYFRDVTTERRAAELLRENSERFQRVARATADAIWDWDLRSGSVWWSDGMERTFEISRDEIAANPAFWSERIHPDDADRVVAGIQAVLAGEDEAWADRYRFRRGDGRYARVHDRGYVVRDEDGAAVRMVGGVSDETARLEAERRVQEQAELLGKAQDAIVVRQMDHTITFWNPSAERLYGWTTEDAVGRSVESLLYADPTPFRNAMERLLEDGEWVGELEQRRKDKSKITVESRWTLVRDDEGRPDRVLAINTDVTDRKKLLAQFLRAQRMESIGTLAGGIAHDLNNVLAPILLSIELLKLDEEDPETRETLETIEASARRGADMVRQVLSFARGVESARVALNVERFVTDVERVVRDTFPKNITFRTDIPDDLWPLLGDPTQIHQVFLNLFVNARDAMPEGGTLLLEAENVTIDEHYASLSGQAEPGPYVRLSVVDTGEGMPPEVVEQVFDPFFTTKEVGKGTGLGLSTVSAIVRGHGGFVNVYSEPGRGTTFRVYLPAGDHEASLAPRPVEPEAPRGNGELILVVDDEASVRDITRQTLEAFGYRVLTATDGADAVAAYGQRGDEIALVLTDLMMPIMDGPALIRALRRMDPEVRIVAASGIGANSSIVRAADSGVRDFLPKPYTAGTLLQVLARAMEGKA